MASYKQELIQLHQLLAELRVHSNNELGLDASIEDLDAYSDIGITSLDMNAEIDVQLDAILALASDLTDVLEVSDTPERPTEAVPTPETAATGPTTKTTLHDIETDTAETGEVTAAAEDSPDPRVIRVYETESQTPELCDTSLTDAWADVKQREERSPMETWGETDDSTTTQAEIVTPDNPEQQEATVSASDADAEDAVAEAEGSSEQLTLPTP